jgi:DNA modification methylase
VSRGAALVRANAIALPLADRSVNLSISSPPYFALRSYQDDGEHYDGQIGSEPTPEDFLRALWAVYDEVWRVLVDDGSCFVNLGDKYAGSGGHNNSGLDGRSNRVEAARRPPRDMEPDASIRAPRVSAASIDRLRAAGRTGPDTRDRARATRRNAPDRYVQGTEWARAKSLMGLPWAFALGMSNPAVYRDPIDPPAVLPCPTCLGAGVVAAGTALVDCAPCSGAGRVVRPHPQWVWRAEIIWDKPNGLPESVTDRVRRNHEVFLHFTKEGRYYASVDEVREPTGREADPDEYAQAYMGVIKATDDEGRQINHRSGVGKPHLSHPLGRAPGSVWRIPSEPLVVPDHVGVDHFAAFPQEWPRRLILGWSPPGVCTACGAGRRPIIANTTVTDEAKRQQFAAKQQEKSAGVQTGGTAATALVGVEVERRIAGYECDCPDTEAPTRPAIVLDPFGGTGTTAMVARALGRFGVSVDLSADYLRLARWRVFESGHAQKAIDRSKRDAQHDLFSTTAREASA